MDGLLRAFAGTFDGQRYLHRRAFTGDLIASHLYEDLLTLGRSPKFVDRVRTGQLVVNTENKIKGRPGRRGDGTLGTISPGAAGQREAGFQVAKGPVANLEIGCETKILATKMTAQIDRVMTDLRGQAMVFHGQNVRAIRVALVGVNFAKEYTGYEGERQFDAKTPPVREAAEIVRRLDQFVRPSFDELIVLRFAATNRPPFLFSWVDSADTAMTYGSALVRISDEYQARF